MVFAHVDDPIFTCFSYTYLLVTCLLYMMGPHILVKHNQHMVREGELTATGDFMNDRPL